MTQPDWDQGAVQSSLADLERGRAQLYAQLAATDDFRRGSITENYRRCGKANCACAEPEHPGHGPRYLLTRSVAGRTKGRQLSPGPDLERARREIASYQRFVLLSQQIVAVNDAICDARPGSTLADAEPTAATRAKKRGLVVGIGAHVAADVDSWAASALEPVALPQLAATQPGTVAVTQAITVAAGVYAPGHLGELTQYLPFEVVDDVLDLTRTRQRRLRCRRSWKLALAQIP